MKRRKFLKNAAAFATTPALPVKLAANPLPVPIAAYDKAAHWAGLWVHSTAATYQNILGVDYETGLAVFKRLQADGILGMSDGIGVAKAVTPYYEIPQVAARLKKAMARPAPTPSATSKTDLPEKLKDLAKNTTKTLDETEDEAHPDLETAKRPEPRPEVETKSTA